jgi:hypothetical protein
MSISQREVDVMDHQARQWWESRGAFEKSQRTGADDSEEAERRFAALNVADRWHLSQGHIESVAHFNWRSEVKP